MNPEPAIDNELRVLLQEIAEGPRRSPLFTEIPRPTRIDLSTWKPVSSRTARLTSAERHLLDVYRDDAARILRDAAEWRLLQSPMMEAQTLTYLTADQKREMPEPTQSIAALEGALRSVSPPWPDHRTTVTSRLGSAMLSSQTTNAYQLAALSLKFVQHDSGWIQLGRALLVDGHSASSLRVLAQVARNNRHPCLRSCALGWIAVIYGLAGDTHSAAIAQSRAAAVVDPTPASLLSWLTEALLAGDEDLARAAAEACDALLRPEAPAIEEWITRRDRRRALGLISITEDARRLARALELELGPVAHIAIHGLV